MIKYEIDKNGFLTGSWATVGSFDNFVELNEPLAEIDKNLKWNGNEFVKDVNPEIVKQNNKKELNDLKQWFDCFYTQHEQKFRRLSALDKNDDDGVNANIKLGSLYSEAEVKRMRIQELENMICE